MRIVTHTCSNTEIVAALGQGGSIVGVDDHSDHPADVVQGAARIGPDNAIDVERVKALDPDLVITSLTIPGHEACVERLNDAGLPILVLEPTHIDHVPENIRTIAAALGVAERGKALAAEVASGLSPEPVSFAPDQAPAIAVEWWPKPVIVPGRHSWVTQMLERLGARNPWCVHDEKSVALDPEEPPEHDVDAIVIAWCGVPLAKYRPDVVRRRAAWNETRAIRHDRITPISEAYLGRPGPRLVQGMAALRKVIDDLHDGKACPLP